MALSEYPVLVAEDDSWFSLPWLIKNRNVTTLVDQLHGRRHHVRSIADPGHTLYSMANDNYQMNQFINLIEDLHNNGNVSPKAILFSGGGNDFIEALPYLLNDKKGNQSKVLDYKSVDAFQGALKWNYYLWCRKVTEACKEKFKVDIPILIHGYAHFIPDGRKLRSGNFSSGPWLSPIFKRKGHTDFNQNTTTLKTLVDRLNDCIIRPLSEEFTDIDVRYVDLRQVLIPEDKTETHKTYWKDEVHPTKKGYKKIAKRFIRVIKKL